VLRTLPGVGLYFLWHPGSRDHFSGYGLVVAPWQLVGILMVDRPTVADPAWLADIERTFGSYQLAAMTHTGERGIICQMQVAEDSHRYLRRLIHPLSREVRKVPRALRRQPPAVTLEVRWQADQQGWVSSIIRPFAPKFRLGQLVAIPGALQPLAEAGQSPMDFVRHHQSGDWGEVPEEDRHENEFSVKHGFRILSAYRTARAVRI
jgi:hypothetical protein